MDLEPSVDQLDMVGTVEAWLTEELSRPQLHERLRTGATPDAGAWPEPQASACSPSDCPGLPVVPTAPSSRKRSSLFLAALGQRDGRADAVFQVSAAKRAASLAAVENARADVQIHGGMGFTWENDTHQFLTRAHVLDQLFGNRHAVRADMLGHAPAMP